MPRLLIVYNPNSSQFVHVKDEILSRITNLPGFLIGKFEIEKTSFEINIARLVKVLKDGDLVLAAGGDATADVTANAILKSKKEITFAVLPYGNFNDLARTLGPIKFESLREHLHSKKFYPLEVIVNGKFWRYATCYATIGMTAEAVKIFDKPKIRGDMQKGRKSSWRSYLQLVGWYFNHHRKNFIPEFKLNGKLQHSKTSDYFAINGKYVARIMNGSADFSKPKTFHSKAERLTSSPRFLTWVTKSVFHRVSGEETTQDVLDFLQPATVSIQTAGECQTFNDVTRIEIKKPDCFLKVIIK